MSVLAIVRTEWRRGWRSRRLWALAATATLLLVGSVLTQSASPRADLQPAEAAMYSGVTLFSLLFPLALLVGNYGAVAGEFDAGSARYLLGLPNSRWAVLLGKVLGRTAVAWAGVLAAFVLCGTTLLVRFGRVPAVPFAAVGGLSLLFTAAWTAIGVGLSASARRGSRALAAGVGSYVVLVVYWLFVPDVNPESLTARFVEDVLGLSARPGLYDFVFQAAPSTAYSFAVTRLLFDSTPARVFLRPWFLVFVLLGWVVAPTLLGYLRFRRIEIA